jgi:hypothetical protein
VRMSQLAKVKLGGLQRERCAVCSFRLLEERDTSLCNFDRLLVVLLTSVDVD